MVRNTRPQVRRRSRQQQKILLYVLPFTFFVSGSSARSASWCTGDDEPVVDGSAALRHRAHAGPDAPAKDTRPRRRSSAQGHPQVGARSPLWTSMGCRTPRCRSIEPAAGRPGGGERVVRAGSPRAARHTLLRPAGSGAYQPTAPAGPSPATAAGATEDRRAAPAGVVPVEPADAFRYARRAVRNGLGVDQATSRTGTCGEVRDGRDTDDVRPSPMRRASRDTRARAERAPDRLDRLEQEGEYCRRLHRGAARYGGP